jgi:hypothetical protein
MLVLVATVHKNSPAFCCGAEAFLAAKGDGQQKDHDIFVGAGAPAACADPKTDSRSGAPASGPIKP